MSDKNAVTKVTLIAEREDPLETVRRAVAFADAMVAEGARVVVTGDLSISVHFDVPKPDPDAG